MSLIFYVDIKKLVPQNHIFRKVDKVFDLSFVRQLSEPFYCQNNERPSVDLDIFLVSNMTVDLHEEITCNLPYSWYCRLSINDRVPDHSSLSRIKDRYGEKIFENFFDKVIEVRKETWLVKGQR